MCPAGTVRAPSPPTGGAAARASIRSQESHHGQDRRHSAGIRIAAHLCAPDTAAPAPLSRWSPATPALA